MTRRNRERLRPWLLSLVLLIIVLMFVVPYTVLTDINAWYGSFLFWSVSTLVVLVIVAFLSFEWKD